MFGRGSPFVQVDAHPCSHSPRLHSNIPSSQGAVPSFQIETGQVCWSSGSTSRDTTS